MLIKVAVLYRDADLGDSVGGLGPPRLLVLAILGELHEARHEGRQLVFADVLAAETLLQLLAALVQAAHAHEARHVDHAA